MNFFKTQKVGTPFWGNLGASSLILRLSRKRVRVASSDLDYWRRIKLWAQMCSLVLATVMMW